MLTQLANDEVAFRFESDDGRNKGGNKMNIERDPYGFMYTMNTINQAISLLQSHGYKVEAPYIDPTDEEICERIRHENEKAGYVVDWDNEFELKYYICYDTYVKNYCLCSKTYDKVLGATYTSGEIADTIVDELNEGRFVRV